jgi:hypothetical protein
MMEFKQTETFVDGESASRMKGYVLGSHLDWIVWPFGIPGM